jgi:hypothetical protein
VTMEVVALVGLAVAPVLVLLVVMVMPALNGTPRTVLVEGVVEEVQLEEAAEQAALEAAVGSTAQPEPVEGMIAARSATAEVVGRAL